MDEVNTANPLYCPVPTCSTFLPPRLFDTFTAKVTCPTCSAVTCTKCKQLATSDDHVCAKDDGPDKPMLEKYNYKACPKCGTGIAKMFGCPHIRCHCGAQWCWRCRRPIDDCECSPLDQYLDDNDGHDNGSDVASGERVNLDDPPAGLEGGWRASTLDFGPEPTENPETDIWGCRHEFVALENVDVPRFWLVGVNPWQDDAMEVECRCCFRKVKLGYDGETASTDDNETDVEGAAEDTVDAPWYSYAFLCILCNTIYCGECKQTAEEKMATAEEE